MSDAAYSFSSLGPDAVGAVDAGRRYHASGSTAPAYRELATPDQIRAEMLAMQQNHATPLSVPAVWACVNLLSRSVASLPAALYRVKAGVHKVAEDHAAHSLLAVAPNSISTPFDMMQIIMVHVLLKGNFYAQKVTFQGKIQSILPLDPGRVTPKLQGDGRLVYEYAPDGKPKKTFQQPEIVHIRGLTTDGIVGLSVLGAARKAIEGAAATEAYGQSMFSRGARPSGVLETEAEMSAEAIGRLRSQFDEQHAGLENAHRTMVLEGGLKWKPITLDAEDTQFIESRKFSRSEIAMFFGVPPHLIGDIDRGTSWGSGIEQQNRGFLIYTLGAYLTTIAQSLRRDLLSENERAKYVVKFDTSALEKADFGPRQAGLAVMRNNGIINANEWRKIEGLNPREDAAADEYRDAPAGSGDGPAPERENPDERNSSRAARKPSLAVAR